VWWWSGCFEAVRFGEVVVGCGVLVEELWCGGAGPRSVLRGGVGFGVPNESLGLRWRWFLVFRCSGASGFSRVLSGVLCSGGGFAVVFG
jgi:hypothetical protein